MGLSSLSDNGTKNDRLVILTVSRIVAYMLEHFMMGRTFFYYFKWMIS